MQRDQCRISCSDTIRGLDCKRGCPKYTVEAVLPKKSQAIVMPGATILEVAGHLEIPVCLHARVQSQVLCDCIPRRGQPLGCNGNWKFATVIDVTDECPLSKGKADAPIALQKSANVRKADIPHHRSQPFWVH